jgi:hypothetical protein
VTIASRYVARKEQFTHEQRLRLVEDDLDANDEEFATIRSGMATLDKTINDKLNRLLWAVVSLAFAITGAALAFAWSGGG